MNNICQFLWNLFLNLKIFTLWNNTNFRKIRGGSDGELLVHLFLTYAAYESHTRKPLYMSAYNLMYVPYCYRINHPDEVYPATRLGYPSAPKGLPKKGNIRLKKNP